MNKRVIGYLLIIIGIFIFSYKMINKRYVEVKEKNKISYSLNKQTNYKYLDMDDLYDMVLVIPSINLKKGIYKKNNKKNDISINVAINKDSDYPDTTNSNVILMAHSGSGNNAYFNNLTKLDNNSLIELYYNHKKYIYKYDHSYCVLKNGKINIPEENKKTISLITCSRDDKKIQVVYVGYLIDEIEY